MSGSLNVQLDQQDINGHTPLHLAVKAGNEMLVQMLIKEGADFLVGDNDGWTALQYAVRKGYIKIVQQLLDIPIPSPIFELVPSFPSSITEVGEDN